MCGVQKNISAEIEFRLWEWFGHAGNTDATTPYSLDDYAYHPWAPMEKAAWRGHKNYFAYFQERA